MTSQEIARHQNCHRSHERREDLPELGALGYRFIFITLFASHAATYAVWNAMEELVRDQEQAQWRLEKAKVGHPTESHHVMARVAHFQELEKKYIPGTAERIKSSAGFDDRRLH